MRDSSRTVSLRYLPDIVTLISLFVLGASLCAGHSIQGTSSAQGASITLTRWLAVHTPNQWFPNWYGGMAATDTLPLGFSWIAARLATLANWSPTRACDTLATITFALLPSVTYLLGRILVPGRFVSVVSSILLTTLSPSCLIVPAIRKDMGGLIAGHIYVQVFRYGQSAHLLSLILSDSFLAIAGPLFITNRSWARFLAPILLMLIVVTDATALYAVVIVLFSILITRRRAAIPIYWINVPLVGITTLLLCYGAGSSPSVKLFLTNLHITDPSVLDNSSFFVYLGIDLTVFMILLIFKKANIPETFQMLFVICFLLGSVAIGRELFNWHLLPNPELLLMEFDIAGVVLISYALYLFWRSTDVRTHLVLGAALAFYFGFQWHQEKATLQSKTDRPIRDTREYRALLAIELIDPTSRVFTPDGPGRLLNTFSDRVQLTGCCDYSVPNVEYRNALSSVTGPSADATVPILWLKAYGVGAVAVNPENFANPAKFNGVLREAWREGDTVIYDVGRHSRSLAHVIAPAQAIKYLPENSLDRQLLEPYVSAIESPQATDAVVQELDDGNFRIATTVKADELVSFQMNYSSQWIATVNGKRQPIVCDGLGLMLISPHCSGGCVIDLRYNPERRAAPLAAGLSLFLVFGAFGVPTDRLTRRFKARAAQCSVVATLLALLLCSAWMAEDAFIGFRVIDNLLNGYGLRWNVSERVQVFTDPLFIGMTAGATFLFGHIYVTTVIISLGLTGFALCLILRKSVSLTLLLVFAGLLFSKGFVDFSTAGFENPATHLALAGYLYFYWRGKNSLALSLMAALITLNRMDSLLFVLPSLAVAYAHEGRRVWRDALIGWSPLLLWAIFSVVYYGFFFPNTAYAKLGTGIPLAEVVAQGYRYYANAWSNDTATLIFIGLGVVTGIVSKQWAITLGVALNLIYIAFVGGDYMGSRFFTPACFVSAALIAAMWPFSQKTTTAAISAIIAAGASVPKPTLTSVYRGFGEPWPIDAAGIADERAYWNPCTGIWSYFGRNGEQSPTYLGRPDNVHYWSCYGPPNIGVRVPGGWPNAKDARTGSLLRTMGPIVYGSSTIGMLGYFAGPKTYVVDDMALADVLLARLPTANAMIRIGHFRRDLPQGYLKTIETGRDVLTDPEIATCYEQLHLITSGDIWRKNRFAQIAHYAVSRCRVSNSHGGGWLHSR